MLSTPSNLINRSGTFYFRIRVPAALKSRFGCQELKLSLKTTDPKEARKRVAVITCKVTQLFEQLNFHQSGLMAKLTPDQLKDLVREYVRIGFTLGPTVRNYDDLDGHYSVYNDFYTDFKDALVSNTNSRNMSNRPKAINGQQIKRSWADHQLDIWGLQGCDDPDSKERFFREFIKPEIQLMEERQKRLYSNAGVRRLNEILATFGMNESLAVRSPQAITETQPEKTSMTLGKLVDDYWENRENVWKPRTKTENGTIKTHFLEHMGVNTQVHTITYDQMKAYRQILLDKSRAVRTINKYFVFIGGVFNHGVKIGQMRINLTNGLKMQDKRKKHTLRDIFTIDDLKLMFESEAYQNNGFDSDHKFWLPLLGLFTGARLEELCQLRASQVFQDEETGIWCIRIAEDYPDQSVKTAELRIIPIHQFLTTLGFHQWVHSKKPDDRVFSKLIRVNHRWGHYYSKQFGLFRQACGIGGEKGKKVYHSFRHTVETILQDLEVDQKYVNQLTGHTEKGESARYGKPNIKLIFERAVMALPWPDELALDKIKSRWIVAE